MSPGNSYFKDDEVRHLLKSVVEKYGRTAVVVADVPAISTYIAFGYPENRARRDKAIPQGNAFRNRTDRIRKELGYTTDQVHIVNWEGDIENNPEYQAKYVAIKNLYDTNQKFQEAADETTKQVLIHSDRDILDVDAATKIAVHYLLSEFAFLEFAPEYFNEKSVSYVYHKNWPVYEDYIAGLFDGVERPYLDFILVENPYETFNQLVHIDTPLGNNSVFETNILRAGFTPYDPVLMFDKESRAFSGIFYEILERIAKEEGWKVVWTEETGYGVIQDGLNSNRFDIFGSTVWPTPERRKEALLSVSVYDSKIYAWVRDTDTSVTLDEIRNDESYRIAIKERDFTDSMVQSDFPRNRLIRVPQLAAVDSMLELVSENKADMTFTEPYLGELFNKKATQKLVHIGEPLRFYENTFMVSKENRSFSMLKKALFQT